MRTLQRILAFMIMMALVCAFTLPAHAAYRVLIVGDSWAQLTNQHGSIDQALGDFGHPTKDAKGNVTAIGGTTAAWWVGNLGLITNELNANPSIDVVYIYIGGNDFLGGWNTGLSTSQENALFDQIRNNINTMVQHCLSIRSNIRVVIGGYDYLNFYETVQNDPFGSPGIMWAAMGQPSVEQLNLALARLEARKRDLALGNSRVEYIHNMGLMQYAVGYPSLGVVPYYTPFPGGAPNYNPWPGGITWLPSPPEILANNGTDPIHYNWHGYYYLAWNLCYQWLDAYFDTHP